jgi:hypothetical protein
LLPALAIIAAPGLLRAWRRTVAGPRRWRGPLVFLAPPLLGFLAVVTLVNGINWAVYGVFRNNELRAGSFPAAYGALARITHERWQRYVVFPADAREKAYAVSPAARELAPYLDGELGRRWVASSHPYPRPWGCADVPDACNTEILSGWFVWALREAATAAGHHRSARDADRYYRQLAREINAACDSGRIPCGPPRSGLLPVWRDHYVADTLSASLAILATLIDLKGGHIGIPPSPLTEEQAGIFHKAINAPVSGFTAAPDDGWAQRLRAATTQAIAALYAKVSPPAASVALACYLFLLLAWRGVKSASVSGQALVLLTALLAAIVARVLLLGLLEATSIPSNNLLYLLPTVPLYLLFATASVLFCAAALVNVLRRRGARDA